LDIQKSSTQNCFDRLSIFAAWGMIALGVVLRLRQYLANRSLWLDEAMLALNIVQRSFGGLLKPLDYDQGAPLGFLFLEKLAITLLGNDNEFRLRLLPLLTGCASLILFYLILKRVFKHGGILTGLALFAVSPTLIYYSSEVKQYSSDIFVTLILLWLALESLDNGITRKKAIVLAGAGALAIWFSHPALFVLAAIGIILLVHNRKHFMPVVAVGGAWLASFAVLYLVSLRWLSSNEFLLGFWQEFFMPMPPEFSWLWNAFLGLFRDPGGLDGFAPALFAAALTGGLVLARRRWQVAGIILLPFFFVLAASALQKYPFSGRLMLFSAPLLFILLGACIDWLSTLELRVSFPVQLSALLAFVLAVGMLFAPTTVSFGRFMVPPYNEHIRPAMAYLKQNYAPGDAIYVYYWSIPAFRYYAPFFGLSDLDYLSGKDPDVDIVVSELNQLKSHKRVWILMSHLTKKGIAIRETVLANLYPADQRKATFNIPGTNVFLYLYELENIK
jgi:hypothetical protein